MACLNLSRAGKDADEELDDSTRQKYLAIMQFLTERELIETLVAFEKETGIKYSGAFRVNNILQTALDMFAKYSPDMGEGAAPSEEDAFQLEGGICCTGQSIGDGATVKTNVTSVVWAVASYDEHTAVVATTDKKVAVLNESGVLAELDGFASPVLGLDAGPMVTTPDGLEVHDVLACQMGGEVSTLRLRRPKDDGSWSLEVVQQFKDHSKHVSSGRFAPPPAEGGAPQHFVTVSRDHCANVYRRDPSGVWALVGTARMQAEVTCCCWLSDRTFAFTAREDHNLRYWDVDGSASGLPCEKMKTNLNALGDSVVSFAVLAIAVSPDRQLVAVSTDKSRVIVLRAFTDKQLRNLYGAIAEEYDMPSVAFSADQTYLYATTTLPMTESIKERGLDDKAMCGQIVVFELMSGHPVLKLPCHTKPVRSLSRHPLSEALVTGSFDKTVRFWS